MYAAMGLGMDMLCGRREDLGAQTIRTLDEEIVQLDGGLFDDLTAASTAQSVPPPVEISPPVSQSTYARAVERACRADQRATTAFLGISLGLVIGSLVIGLDVGSRALAPTFAATAWIREVAALTFARAPLAPVDPAPLAPASVEPALRASAPIAEQPTGAIALKSPFPNASMTAPAVPATSLAAAPRRDVAPAAVVPARRALDAPKAGLPGQGINPSAAATALGIAARRADRCLESGDPRTTMAVRVTFAPSGRVTTAVVNGGPFAGTQVGGCIATALRTATVAPFAGEPVTVVRSVAVR
jgi:hypothetical protein